MLQSPPFYPLTLFELITPRSLMLTTDSASHPPAFNFHSSCQSSWGWIATVYAYLTHEYGPPLNFEGLPSLITYHTMH